MKKIIVTLLLAVVSMGAFAQFEKGTKYVNASLSGFGLSYSKQPGFCMNIEAAGGYFVADSWMLKGLIGWDHVGGSNTFDLGAGFRYYMKKYGVFFGTGIKYGLTGAGGGDFGDAAVVHNVYLPLEAGYCFYLNDHVTIEPSAYVDMCFNHFKEATKFGLMVSFGYYF